MDLNEEDDESIVGSGTSLPTPEDMPLDGVESESIDDQDPSSELTPKPFATIGERRAPRQLWLISYSDFMTILMIFFLAMYGYTYLAKATLLKMQKEQITYSEFTGRMLEIKEKLGSQLEIKDDVDKVVLGLNENILFASGSAHLAENASATLEELAKSIKLIEGDIIVQGHTDNVPIRRGRFKSNWELSSARAFSVINELTQMGVPPERLAAWGFGENRPRVDNLSPENRSLNRRIEVVILKKKEKASGGSHGG